jgi:hypothetical protein
MAPAGSDPADAVAQIDPVRAFGALRRPVMNRKQHGVALLERHDLGAALHARPLLGQNEFAAGEIPPGL